MADFRTVDGRGNNENNPEWGVVDTQLLRFSKADYADGISELAGEDRPMAREISNSIFDQQELIGNDFGNNNLLWMWGQFLDHDLSLTESGLTETEESNMNVPTGDLMFDPLGTGTSFISFKRSEFDHDTGTGVDNPRQQINQITPYLDASHVYGSDAVRQEALRTDDGKLLMSDGELMGFNTQGLPNAPTTSPTLFLAGDVRANENVGLTSLHTLFAREHNRLVDELSAAHPDWDGDRLYQEARLLVEAELQIITYSEFLPALLGEGAIASWQGYDDSVNAQVANEFSTAAFRLGHTMLSTDILRSKEDGSESEFGHLLLRDAFFRPDRLINEGGIEDVLRGAAIKEAEAIDSLIVDDVRNFLFGPPGAGGFDLASLNIQRGRDHGLEDYNGVREAYGLARVESFDQITSDVELQQKLEDLYGTVDDIDLYVGGLSEDRIEGSQLGELFHTIVVDQFTRTRDGDSFYHEHHLTPEQMSYVQGVTLAQVIELNSSVEHIQDDVFTAYDRLAGTESDDRLFAEDDHTLVLAGAGRDKIFGGDGVQQIEGEEGNDHIHARGGDDIVNGGAGRDYLYGDDGDDLINGDEGRDFLSGGKGDDTLFGGEGRDRHHGGEGKDHFIVSKGRDSILDFNTDEDVLDFSLDGAISSLDDLTIRQRKMGLRLTDEEGDSLFLRGVYDLSDAQIVFAGQEVTPVENVITGGPGSTLWGTKGDDLFGDTEGRQIVLGREGHDVFIVDGNRADYEVKEIADWGMYRIEGDDGFDLLFHIEQIRFDDGEFNTGSLADDGF